MTFDEFLAWSNEDTHAEWIDGKVEFLIPVSTIHQLISSFLVMLLRMFVQRNPVGSVFHTPMLMRLAARPSGREPDILFIAHSNLSSVRENYIDRPADLVVEIISPESRTRDRVEKYREYAQSGVLEYWLIDPLLKTAEFFRLRDGAYEPASIDAEGRFWSDALPGFWMMVPWIWEEPTLDAILAAWESGPTRDVALACDDEGLLIYPPKPGLDTNAPHLA